MQNAANEDVYSHILVISENSACGKCDITLLVSF